jgi:hypothetical protein
VPMSWIGAIRKVRAHEYCQPKCLVTRPPKDSDAAPASWVVACSGSTLVNTLIEPVDRSLQIHCEAEIFPAVIAKAMMMPYGVVSFICGG